MKELQNLNHKDAVIILAHLVIIANWFANDAGTIAWAGDSGMTAQAVSSAGGTE